MPTATRDLAIDELNFCLTRLSNSTARYILDANPYTTDRDKGALAALKEATTEETTLLEECARLVERLDGIPATGLPDPELAEMNYLSFPYLLDVLIKETEKELAHFNAGLKRAESSEPAKAFVQKLIDARNAQLKKFNDIREKSYPSEPRP